MAVSSQAAERPEAASAPDDFGGMVLKARAEDGLQHRQAIAQVLLASFMCKLAKTCCGIAQVQSQLLIGCIRVC